MHASSQGQHCRAFLKSVQMLLPLAALAIAGTARAAMPQYRGVNDFGAFGADSNDYASNGGTMKTWGIDIVRQDVPDFDSINLGTSGSTINGSYVNGLQSVVNNIDSTVGQSTVTILCPFNYNYNGTDVTLSGASPSSEGFFSAYNSRLAATAEQFKSQSNVWIELWNEPYSNSSSSTEQSWVSTTETMINSIRNGTGYNGTIVVPAPDFSGDYNSIINYGQSLDSYDPDHNVIFDLHAYSNFITGNEGSEQSTLQTIKNSGNNVLFGEVGPAVLGTSNVQDVSTFITAMENTGISGIAWNWNDQDDNTLHNSNGTLNNTSANHDWATQWYDYTQGAAAALPEPTTLGTILCVMPWMLRRRRSSTGAGQR